MSDNLIGEEITRRPDNDDLAFLYYEKLYRGPLEKALAELAESERDAYWSSYNHFVQTYINRVLATVRALNIDVLEYWVNNPAAASDVGNFKQIQYDIDGTIIELQIRYAQIDRRASIRLESTVRERIRDYINKIKITIEAVELPIERKEALLRRLNAFAIEVDRDRTRLAAFGSLVVEIASGTAKVERKLRPIRKWLDSIANVMHEARASESAQSFALSAPSKALRAPPKQISTTRAADDATKLWAADDLPKPSGDLDDEIPF